ncbi:hypothetical protein J6590_050316 [Homalodisca vitripennis]|nr:hypothetical protein J6590_050316 [Homalodisca vitripennis]
MERKGFKHSRKLLGVQSRCSHGTGCTSRVQVTIMRITIIRNTSVDESDILTRHQCMLFLRHRVVSSEMMEQEGDGQKGEGVKASRFRPFVLILDFSVTYMLQAVPQEKQVLCGYFSSIEECQEVLFRHWIWFLKQRL